MNTFPDTPPENLNSVASILWKITETKKLSAPNKYHTRPSITYAGIVFVLAKPDSANPWHLYMKDSTDGVYLGKITPDGKILPCYNFPTCYQISAEQTAKIESLLADPYNAIIKEGKETTTCCCCGRRLTNPISVKLGIGPICREAYFPWLEPVDSPDDYPTTDQITLFDL